jgi:hypothetical protein
LSGELKVPECEGCRVGVCQLDPCSLSWIDLFRATLVSERSVEMTEELLLLSERLEQDWVFDRWTLNNLERLTFGAIKFCEVFGWRS